MRIEADMWLRWGDVHVFLTHIIESQPKSGNKVVFPYIRNNHNSSGPNSKSCRYGFKNDLLDKRENNTWDWMKFFKARKKEEFEMAAMQNESVKKAVKVVKTMSADDEARAKAFQEEKYRRDKYATEHRVEGLIK